MAEAINLTDEIQRLHGRTQNEVLFVTQTGPRYMIGARYKFGNRSDELAAPATAPRLRAEKAAVPQRLFRLRWRRAMSESGERVGE